MAQCDCQAQPIPSLTDVQIYNYEPNDMMLIQGMFSRQEKENPVDSHEVLSLK